MSGGEDICHNMQQLVRKQWRLRKVRRRSPKRWMRAGQDLFVLQLGVLQVEPSSLSKYTHRFHQVQQHTLPNVLDVREVWGGWDVGRVTTLICVPTLCHCIQGSQTVPCAKISRRPHCFFIIQMYSSDLYRPAHHCRAKCTFSSALHRPNTLHTFLLTCPSLVTSN